MAVKVIGTLVAFYFVHSLYFPSRANWMMHAYTTGIFRRKSLNLEDLDSNFLPYVVPVFLSGIQVVSRRTCTCRFFATCSVIFCIIFDSILIPIQHQIGQDTALMADEHELFVHRDSNCVRAWRFSLIAFIFFRMDWFRMLRNFGTVFENNQTHPKCRVRWKQTVRTECLVALTVGKHRSRHQNCYVEKWFGFSMNLSIRVAGSLWTIHDEWVVRRPTTSQEGLPRNCYVSYFAHVWNVHMAQL